MEIYSLHHLMKFTLILIQICALFPLQGVLAPNSSKLRFKWCTLQMLYGWIVWIGLAFNLFCIWPMVHFREKNGNLSGISNSSLLRSAVPPLVIYFLFLYISFKWPEFINKWEHFEERMLLLIPNKTTYLKIVLLNVVFVILRLAYFLGGYLVVAVRVVECLDITSTRYFMDALFHVRFPHILQVTSPALWKYSLMMFLETISCFSWLACDLLKLNISLVLCEKFKNFNSHLKYKTPSKATSPRFWQDMRREYTMLTALINLTDSIIGPMIFASVAFETVNVILFTYIALTNAYTLLSYIYFAVFFISHLSVDIYVLKKMASIFDESKQPLRVLKTLPTINYFAEVKRFHLQVRKNTITLTGCKFFTVTHTTILSIASALITYEVVLVQLGNLKKPDSYKISELKLNSTMVYCSWVQNYLQTNE